jgi:hypothetical protein
MNGTDDGDLRPGDLLIGAEAICAYLIELGFEDLKPAKIYYLKRAGILPIGNLAGDAGTLVSTKSRLAKHMDRKARGSSAA